ncbi:hypothetical protein NLJ89_g11593 [Agrocybe chaxingu]|uniref:PIPK domain-containing protein n=1 Tax=Agrocybe chaxingu TaxID=84603 RepID=A0A9W8JPN8_9AGAR|nr:hypothetical protein NLJ89_g11593 [Agrocybe chaxingu]
MPSSPAPSHPGPQRSNSLLVPQPQPYPRSPIESNAYEMRVRTPLNEDAYGGYYGHDPRANTTGSTALSPRRFITGHTKGASQQFTVDDAVLGEGSVELASDIEIHAEQIRRERMSKRAKQQQEAEAALTRADTLPQDTDTPLVGNLIGEDHVNYVLMYNMLTGIRIGVSRRQAKVKRQLKDEDFNAKHKFSFDIVGNELTPSAKYDFKFKDYAPWVFRYLREDIFHLDPADYLLSLTAKYILSELGSPGKSGSFFYFSRDYRFITHSKSFR